MTPHPGARLPHEPAPSPRAPGSSDTSTQDKDLLSRFNPDIIGFGLITSWLEKPSARVESTDLTSQSHNDMSGKEQE